MKRLAAKISALGKERFQPFLRFYKDAHRLEIGVRVPLDVSTLLEILHGVFAGELLAYAVQLGFNPS